MPLWQVERIPGPSELFIDNPLLTDVIGKF